MATTKNTNVIGKMPLPETRERLIRALTKHLELHPNDQQSSNRLKNLG